MEIQGLYTEMLNRKLSSRTVRYTHSVIRLALAQVVKWRMLARNPADCVDLPKISKKEMAALSPEEAGRFLAAAAKDKYATLFARAITTGMRPGEYHWTSMEGREAEGGRSVTLLA